MDNIRNMEHAYLLFKSFSFKDYQEFLKNKNLFYFENDKLTECSKNILLLNLKN